MRVSTPEGVYLREQHSHQHPSGKDRTHRLELHGTGITILDNTFDISKQAGDSETKNMAINIGQRDNTSKFILTDDGNTISAGTASLYTAALGSGSNQYVAVSGSKVLDRNGNDKVITAMVWKTTTGETFEMKTID